METSLPKFSRAAQKISVAQNLGGLQPPSPPPARNCLGMGNHQKGIDKNLNHVSGEQNGPNYASRKTIRDQDPLARWLLF